MLDTSLRLKLVFEDCMDGNFSKVQFLVVALAIVFTVAGCTQSGGQLGALEGVVPSTTSNQAKTAEKKVDVAAAGAKKPATVKTTQEQFVEKQMALVEKQKKIFE